MKISTQLIPRLLLYVTDTPYLLGKVTFFIPYYSELKLCGGAVTVSFSNKVTLPTVQMALVVVLLKRQ
jgi:hypothetical protein